MTWPEAGRIAPTRNLTSEGCLELLRTGNSRSRESMPSMGSPWKLHPAHPLSPFSAVPLAT